MRLSHPPEKHFNRNFPIAIVSTPDSSPVSENRIAFMHPFPTSGFRSRPAAPRPARPGLASLLTAALLFAQSTLASVSPLPDLGEIRFPQTPEYKRSPRDPFVDASVKKTLLTPGATNATTGKREPEITAYAREFNQILGQLYAIQGLVSSPKGGSALIGRRILRIGDSLEIHLNEAILKRLEQTNRIYNLGLDEILKSGVIPAKLAKVEPTGIKLSVAGMNAPLELPFVRKKTTAPLPLQAPSEKPGSATDDDARP
ncbi:MAG: hypothetical protein RLZZ244_1404 [Verrucomicrobiota bacterium]